MKIYRIQSRQRVDWPIEKVFDFFSNACNLELLTPPWLRFRVLTPLPILMRAGTRIEYAISWHGLPLRWVTQIEEWTPGQRFVDIQLRGPYRLWRHTHTFEAAGDGTVIEDVVHYALRAGLVGQIAHALVVGRDVRRIFDYRTDRVRRLMGGESPAPARQSHDLAMSA